MRTLYLHIGTHKTGTTALQKFFSLNTGVLATHGVCYPRVGRVATATAHHDIASALKGPPFPLRQPKGTVDEFTAGLSSCFECHPRVLLSSEVFMRFVPEFKDRLPLDLSMLDRLRCCAERTVVVIYLRRQDEYLESFYMQEIRHDAAMPFADFVAARAPDYLALCRQLVSAFGADNVLVRPYEASLFTGDSLFSDFLSTLGVALDESFVTPEGDINPSLLPEEREFKRLVNALGLPITDLIQFNEPLQQRCERRRKGQEAADAGYALFSTGQRADLLRHCGPVNRRVASEFMKLAPDAWPGQNAQPAADQAPVLAYPGLSEQTLADIVSDIGSASPALVELLSRGVANSLTAPEPLTYNAAKRLQRAL